VHGTNGIDAVEFVEYVWEKRIVFVISCGVAIVLALALSLILPRRYTARSSILIEAPAGNDPRAATAMSPVYLESLKTYESFASSDTLFLRAIQNLHVEASKGNALKVSRPAGTTIMEIDATLNDPRKAQALAQYIAEQTVELNRTLEAKSADDLIGELRAQSQAALERLNKANQGLNSFAASNPIEALENELRDGSAFKFRLEGDLSSARTDLADDTAQQAPEAESLRKQIVSAQARIKAIDSQRRELDGLLERKGSQLDARKSRRSALEAEAQGAQEAYEKIQTRLNDTISSPQFRGQRLRVIDPGIVPQQPSYPRIQLNVIAAFLASLIGTFVYLLLRFGYVRVQRERSERAYSLH
jgi:uncharacterized protein involved in exopolysaccharide biosynthesis